MIAADHDRRFDPAGPNQVIDPLAELRALAVPEPAYAGRQTLKSHFGAGKINPSLQYGIVREQGQYKCVGRVDVAGVA
jgi:hypothetical protein